jgi:hypothetical protein
MNVEPNYWAGQVPNPQQPLSSGLRAVFWVEHLLPAELRRLLVQLDQAAAVR